MTAHCQPLPGNLVDEMLQLVARAICDRPGENAAQRCSRTNQMVHSTMGFAPKDGLEVMLASVVIGHFNLILDSMRDVFQGQAEPVKAKTKTTIVALDRAMLEMIKGLREERRRPSAPSVDVAQHDAAVAAAPELNDAEIPTSFTPTPDDPQPEAAPARPSHAPSSLAPTPISEVAQPRTDETDPDIAMPAINQVVSVASNADFGVTPHSGAPAWTDEDTAALIGRIAANDALLAAADESIAEAWRAHSEAAAVTGD